MIAALRTEYRKLVTTRLWWVLLLVMVVYMAFLAAVMAWTFTQVPTTSPDGTAVPVTDEQIVRAVYTVAVSLGYVFPLIVGAMGMTGEYRHLTITPTLLAEPRRDVVLGAKLVSSALIGVLFGLAGTLAATGTGAGVLAMLGKSTGLGSAGTWRTLGLSVVALAVWAVVGVALATVVTNQVAVLVIALAFTQFVEPILRTVLVLTSWGGGITRFLPGAAGEAISGGSLYTALGLGGNLLAWWQGLLVLSGYALVLAVIGRLTTLRHDVT